MRSSTPRSGSRQTSAVSRHITDAAVREHFQHEGHRTVISQRALQAHADPWLGWTELDGAGQLVAEVSPYAVDLDWSDIDEPEEIAAVVADLGRTTATMHSAADDESGHSLVPFSTERAVDAAIAADEEGFAGLLVDFAHGYGARARADHQIFVDLFRNGRISGLQGSARSRPLGGADRFTCDTPRRWTYPGRSSESFARRFSQRSS